MAMDLKVNGFNIRVVNRLESTPCLKPIELIDIQNIIALLQQIRCEFINFDPPQKNKIVSILRSLKTGKSSNDLPQSSSSMQSHEML